MASNTNTMIITYSQSEKKEVEIRLPSFVRFSENYYKILDEKKVLIVSNFSFRKGVELSIMAHHSPFGVDGWKFISEDEFNEVHRNVSDELLELLPIIFFTEVE